MHDKSYDTLLTRVFFHLIIYFMQVVKLILDGILLTPTEFTPPLINQILNGCWKSQPVDRLTFQQIQDQLISEERRVRYSDRKKSNMDKYYISPMEIASMFETTSIAMHERTTNQQAPSSNQSSKNISNHQSISAMDYLQLIPSSPKEPCSSSHHNATTTFESVI